MKDRIVTVLKSLWFRFVGLFSKKKIEIENPPETLPTPPQDDGTLHHTADGGLSMAGGLVTLTPEQIARRNAEVAAEHSGKLPVDDGDISNGTKTRTLFTSPTIVKFVLRKPASRWQINFQTPPGTHVVFNYMITGPRSYSGSLVVNGGVIQSVTIPGDAPLGEYKLSITSDQTIETQLTLIG